MTSRTLPASRQGRRPRGRLAVLGVVGALLLAVAPVGFVQWQSAGRLTTADRLPEIAVAIVFGAEIYPSGRPSPYLRARLDLAHDLYASGRVRVILVSGDNGEEHYDEPTGMRNYLIGRGVPAERVVADFAGFDTYSTCVRAVRVFGVRSAVLVSQTYHLPRAIATCRSVGLDAWGVGDDTVRSFGGEWAQGSAREWLADAKLVGDLVRGRVPVLGPQETSVTDALAS